MKNKKYGYFMYRDAANYKFTFECPIPESLKDLKVDDETTFEQLGFDLNYVFGSIIKYPFNPNDDHNIVTLEEINKIVTHEDVFYDPNNLQDKTELIHDVLKFGDIDVSLLPEGLENKINHLATYNDNDLDDEHLFSIETLLDAHHDDNILNKEQHAFLEKLKIEMNKKDLAYFRIVKR